MNTQKINALFTTESLMSLQGAALVAMVIPNVLTYLLGPAFAPLEKWVGFGIAMLLALYIASRSTEKSPMKWLIGVLNGFLIFAAAAGLTQVLGAASGGGHTTTGPDSGGPEPLPFFHSWY
ncbi:MAG TPA: hypothetical protein VIV15_03845 [Anaerolineales bacterium]